MCRVLTVQEKRRHFGLIRLDPKRPSPTVLGNTGCTTAGLVHPYEILKLTIAEIKALTSYPEEFQLVGSYRQVGPDREQRPAALDESNCSVYPPPPPHDPIVHAIICYSRSRPD